MTLTRIIDVAFLSLLIRNNLKPDYEIREKYKKI